MRKVIRDPMRLERRIHFYRIDVGLHADGTLIPFDPVPPLRRIAALPFDMAGRYLDRDDRIVCVWPELDDRRPRIMFGNVRRTGLPQVETAGALAALNIDSESGIAEQSHAVFFAGNVLGAEFNFFGPRVSVLAPYFAEKGGTGEITFAALALGSVLRQLDRLQDIRMIQLKTSVARLGEFFYRDANLDEAFRQAFAAGDSTEVEIVLRPKAYSRASLGDKARDFVRRLARDPDSRLAATKLKVSGYNTDTEQVDVVDILHAELITTKQILRVNERSRAVDPDDAYRAIEESYEEVQSELADAPAIHQPTG